MDILNSINDITSGAEFVKADLHIHSFGASASYDVSDDLMTPENIVETAIENELRIISITDHNNIGNVETAVKHAVGKDILVIPGVEISTTQGHLLAYFETYHQLSSFLGKLDISEDKKTCNQGLVQCMDLAKVYKGICVLAHIEIDAGFEKTIGKFGPAMENVVQHEQLLAMEIKKKESAYRYSDSEPVPTEEEDPEGRAIVIERKRLVKLRREALGLDSDYDIPKIMSSDSHTLSGLGVNAEGEKKLTRIKVDDLSFNSFKIALLSASSRIRIEDFIPEQIPHFIGVKLEGGLLDKQVIKFSSNLNCIIGGRGTGKSTLLESVRETSGNSKNAKVVDCDAWPDKISLVYQDETGRNEIFVREKHGEVENRSDPNGLTSLKIESYGQGETADTIQHTDVDPKRLLEFMDNFLDIVDLKQTDKELRDKLLENQGDQEKLQVEVQNIPEVTKLKINAEKKIDVLKKEKVGEIVKLSESLAKERSFRSSLSEDLKNLADNYKEMLDDKQLFKEVESLPDDDIVIGKDQFKEIKSIVKVLSDSVDKISQELKKEFANKITDIDKQVAEWTKKESEIQEKIDKKKVEFEEQGIPFDMGRINKISQDVVYYTQKLKKLEAKKNILGQRQGERKKLIDERVIAKREIFKERTSLARTLEANLKDTVDDFFVKIKFHLGLYSPYFEEYIKGIMDYRTAAVPKATFLTERVSPYELINMVRKNKITEIANLVDTEGNQPFDQHEAQRLVQKLREDNNLNDLESMEFEDRPEITVTKVIKGDTGTSRVTKSLSQLSLGQQQSILLAILLHSKSKHPLIIDQPEDNLDSEFIFKTIVKNLRKVKEQRQVIIVTHNPNIAVLGDAELIIPLKSTSTKSMVIERGSVDNQKTKELTCEVLEGGKRAFIQRKNIYGI